MSIMEKDIEAEFNSAKTVKFEKTPTRDLQVIMKLA
jgi:hypothetical protein